MNAQNGTMSMRVMGLVGSLAAIAILTLGLLAGSLFTAPARAGGPGGATTAPDRTISVPGQGEIRLTPDMAYLNFQIHVPGATADEALAAYQKAATALTEKLHSLGLAESDIVLNPASTWPTQPMPMPATEPGAKAPEQPAGYYSDGMVQVTVRDLGKLQGLAMDGLKAGAGIGLSGVQYALQNDQAARNAAMTKALDNARAQADAVAAKLGLKVKDVASVAVQPSYAGPWMADTKSAGMAAGGDAASANFAPLGSRPDIVVNMMVQVSYNFE